MDLKEALMEIANALQYLESELEKVKAGARA
jgi:hypothetical protein